MKLKGRNTLKKYHGPGVWEDMDGNMHFSVPDMLKHLEMDDTPVNRAMLEKVLNDQLSAAGKKIVKREKPD